MKERLRVFVPLAAGFAAFLAVVSCSATIQSFKVPPKVGTSRVFIVSISGQVSKGSYSGSGFYSGCVLQVPTGFTLVSWWLSSPKYSKWTLNDPKLLALYKAETGQKLYAFSATASGYSYSKTPTLSVMLRAPATAGSYTLKVAGAAQDTRAATWTATSPSGVTNFANITQAPHVATTLVLPGQPAPLFEPDFKGLPWPDTQGWGGVKLADVDRDGRDDIAFSGRLAVGPVVHLSQKNPGGGTLWKNATGTLPSAAGRSDVVFGDFNGDGKLDVACSNATVLLGDGKGGFSKGPTLPFGGEGIDAGDVDGDGRDDVVVGGHMNDTVKFFFSDPVKGWRESSTGLPTGTNPRGGGHRILLHDVTGDGKLDILWCRELLAGGTTIWSGDGKGGWTKVNQTFGTSVGPSTYWEVVPADLDGDGTPELVCGGWQADVKHAGGGVRIWRRTSSTSWTEVTNTGLPLLNEVRDLAVADFDGDGHPDIACGITRGTTYGIELYKGGAGMRFSAWSGNGGLPGPGTGLHWVEGLAAGDFDGDGWPDLAAAVYGTGVIAWRNTSIGLHRFGRGCSGAAAKAPVLTSSGSAKIGSTTLRLGIAYSGTWGGLVLLGSSRTKLAGVPLLPLDLKSLGAPGCTLYTSMDLPAFPVSSAAGGSFPLPIPNLAALDGAVFYAQGLVTAPAANKLGILFTSGGGLKIGR